MKLLHSILKFAFLNGLFHFAVSSHNASYKVFDPTTDGWRNEYYTDFDDSDIDDSIPGYDQYYESNRREEEIRLSTPEECARTCRRGAPPKFCYYHFTFETYHTGGGACRLCVPTTNTSLSSDCQCILADGADVSGLLVANRQLPGPAIQVCLGDMVILDLKNIIPGNHISIHFHGVYQVDWQIYDGVPFLTQCPISECSTFRYQWRAQNIGSHFWHAHTGLHKADGAHGAIIVRGPYENDPNRAFYDIDNFDNAWFIDDFFHNNALDHFPGTEVNQIGQDPDNFLMNGRGQWLDPTTGEYTNTPLTVFNVQANRRYRIRMINACSLLCPIEMQIENHNMSILALDSGDVRPVEVTTIVSLSAERVDFVLNTNQPIGTYWIQIRGLGANCVPRSVQQFAILRYEGSGLEFPPTPRPSFSVGLPRGLIFNPFNDVCDGSTPNVICVKNLESAVPVNPAILRAEADMQIFLPFFFFVYDINDLFRPNTYQRFVDPFNNFSIAAVVGGFSNIFPPSPLISQFDDIPPDFFCGDPSSTPARCEGFNVCHCTNIFNIPLNAMVEVIVADIDPLGLTHPFHLHGHSFHVMGQGLMTTVNITDRNRDRALQLDREAYPPINPRPPAKDTLAVASGGYTIVRFIANNPGWWLFHCHFIQHLYNGMSAIFHVGEDSDLPPIPEDFPRCGDFNRPVLRSNPSPRGGGQINYYPN